MLLAGCVGLGLVPGGQVAAQDRRPPQIMVTIPTNQDTYASPTATLTIGGVASDNVRVVRVTWYTYPDFAQQGTAEGTTSWRFSITLPVGETLVAVTAHDAAGNSREDGVWVTVTGGPPPLGPVTVQILQVSDPGDTIQIARCTVPCGPMQVVVTIPWATREWVDTAVQAADDYCYQAAVVAGPTVFPASAVVCSP
jgi:hypothetical protein